MGKVIDFMDRRVREGGQKRARLMANFVTSIIS